jgi:hypothetical protein
MFSFSDSLPLHPLVVHAAVILLPLAVLLTALLVFIPRSRNPWTWGIALVMTVSGWVSALLAEISGRELAGQVGYPGEHGLIGERVVDAAAVFALLLLVWWGLMVKRPRNRWLLIMRQRVLPVLVVIVGAAMVWQVVLAGHSGARATWEARLASVAPAAQEDSGVGAAETVSVDLSLAMVEKYFTDEDYCWAYINGEIYDLSPLISRHAGGAQAITALCGSDATQAFTMQHEGQATAEEELRSLRVGSAGTVVDVPVERLPEAFLESLGAAVDR